MRRPDLPAILRSRSSAHARCAGAEWECGRDGPTGKPAESVDGGVGTSGRPTARASFAGEEETDNGALTKRTVAFVKSGLDTQIRILYYDSLSARGGFDAGACSCRWEILLDGKACSPALFGGRRQFRFADVQRTTVVGVSEATAGQHALTVKVGLGVGSGGDCFTGGSRTLTASSRCRRSTLEVFGATQGRLQAPSPAWPKRSSSTRSTSSSSRVRRNLRSVTASATTMATKVGGDDDDRAHRARGYADESPSMPRPKAVR